MNPRTIVLSLGAHVVVIAVLVAIKSAPEPRAPTMIRIAETKKTAPKSKAPASAPKPKPKPKPKPTPKARPTPKPRPKPARRTAKARPKATTAPNPRRRAGPPAPRFSGLVLGNADGVGLAVGVTEDVARGPGIAGRLGVSNGRGDGIGGGAVPIQPIQPAPPPKAKAALCTRIERPRIASRQRTIRYAEAARTAGAEGRLVLRLHVSAQGRVTRVEVVKPVHPALDREAIAAARTWRFEPERRCGRAVASTFVIARRFELTD